MSSYRIARRSFLQGVGAGAVGLKIMLRNLEASAQGMTPPPRFLMTHWPVGTVHYHFTPTGTGTTYVPSRIIKPFETAGLRNDMIVLYGLNSSSLHGAGGGHESGTPQTTTGARTPGVRQNGGEGDDAVAGGPSWDQIFLKNVPALYKPNSGAGYVNAICDSRVDSLETSTQCLSYDYATRSVAAATGGTVVENIPLLPVLSPLQLYNKVFSGIMPGGGTGSTTDMAKLLKARKSVLDYSIAQLARMKTLAPASEAPKIDLHTAAIRKIEMMLSQQINNGTITPTTCTPPVAPPSTLTGKSGSKNDYHGATPTTATTADDVTHAEIARAHFGIIRTAFQCDLFRVATFQFSPGTNHVSFKGLYGGDPNSIYMHHPTSHVIMSKADVTGSGPPTSGTNLDVRQSVVEFLAKVQEWYNTLMGELLLTLKNTKDVFGGNLLANTVVPYVTEVAETTHSYSPMPAFIFGGSALGMKGGQYQSLNNRPMNDFWISVAQAYFKSTNPLAMLPTTEKFVRTGVTPIAGLWAAP